MNSIGAAWESYTPTLKGGATTITTTINYCKYARINKNVIIQMDLTCTTAGAANGTWTCTYPSGLAPANSSGWRPYGTINFYDNPTAFYVGVVVPYDATTFAAIAYGGTNYMGTNSPALTIANTDRFMVQLMYEVA